jgi:hypothetical protein
MLQRFVRSLGSVRSLAKSAAVLHRELPKRDVISSYIPSVVRSQREAFLGFSVRNRGILEKEPGQSRSDREQRLQKEVRYAAKSTE